MAELTLAIANRIIEGALSEGGRTGTKPVAVAVTGPEGHLIALQKQDGASMFRVDIAIGKAWGAVAMGISTRGLAKKAQENPSFIHGLSVASGGRILTSPGGVVIRDGSGRVLGAVGISGDTGDNDERLAIRGIETTDLVADV
ncbi:MAG: heme-binding protein [Hyphomicrobiales bacterium]|nr:heme-binding protein [Hyphomicrobiales bacterium]